MQWITRERPKIDRVACPWLITRFLDPAPRFRFAPAEEVLRQARALGATPFDVEGAALSHRGDRCTFDTFLDTYRLDAPALRDLAEIVRAADTARLDLAPQAAGLLAISLGLSRLCLDDDQRMLREGFVVYDALHEWLQHARSEVHGWDPMRATDPGEPTWDRLRSQGVELHLSARRVLVRGAPVALKPKEFSLLVALVARSGRTLSRSFLLQHVWAYQPDVTSRTVDWHVATLRQRLGPAAAPLATVRGMGYRWEDDAAGAAERSPARPGADVARVRGAPRERKPSRRRR